MNNIKEYGSNVFIKKQILKQKLVDGMEYYMLKFIL